MNIIKIYFAWEIRYYINGLYRVNISYYRTSTHKSGIIQ